MDELERAARAFVAASSKWDDRETEPRPGSVVETAEAFQALRAALDARESEPAADAEARKRAESRARNFSLAMNVTLEERESLVASMTNTLLADYTAAERRGAERGADEHEQTRRALDSTDALLREAIEQFGRITSADGSGHADLGRNLEKRRAAIRARADR